MKKKFYLHLTAQDVTFPNLSSSQLSAVVECCKVCNIQYTVSYELSNKLLREVISTGKK